MINTELNKEIIKSIKELKKQIIEDTHFPVYETYISIYYNENTLQGLSLNMYLDKSIEGNLDQKSVEKLKNLIKLCEENNIVFHYTIWTGIFTRLGISDHRELLENDNNKLIEILRKYDTWNIAIFIEYREDSYCLEDENSYIHSIAVHPNLKNSNELDENIEVLKTILKQENMFDNIVCRESIKIDWK